MSSGIGGLYILPLSEAASLTWSARCVSSQDKKRAGA
ncbi:hypothetical protein BU14_0103s0007 [Porphyra umbilicalis]|uniref:Uncharacterized protein n=1 Tax=Porphyra umbilicalis TaxID=2786 RepID=A0A1X6PDE2_PORUM|nr:hypothetical protein BU14_0103s0007 [Porphyra umbilicalis]|eukprot:OSX78663.1 hypothetical protein BU14_0103s0007 [Porphyra umbilicalis]